jgi:hypothetical protein
MICKVLNHLRRRAAPSARPLALACAGALSAGVLAPGAVLGQQGGLVVPGGGGYAVPQSFVPSVPISPYYQSATYPPNQAPNIQDMQNSDRNRYGTNYRPPEANTMCVQARTLTGVVASDDRQVILRFGRDAFYRVRLSKACPALLMGGANVAGVTRSTGGLICDAYDVQLKVVAGDGTVNRCGGATLKRMTVAQVQAASRPTGH